MLTCEPFQLKVDLLKANLPGNPLRSVAKMRWLGDFWAHGFAVKYKHRALLVLDRMLQEPADPQELGFVHLV